MPNLFSDDNPSYVNLTHHAGILSVNTPDTGCTLTTITELIDAINYLPANNDQFAVALNGIPTSITFTQLRVILTDAGEALPPAGRITTNINFTYAGIKPQPANISIRASIAELMHFAFAGYLIDFDPLLPLNSIAAPFDGLARNHDYTSALYALRRTFNIRYINKTFDALT